MAKGFAMKLLVFLLMATSARADASRVDEEQNDQYPFDVFWESGEDEDRQDLSQVLERLLRKEQAECQLTRQCNHEADRSAIDPAEVKTSEVNFEAYNENEEASYSNPFDDSESPQLQSNIAAPEIGQIRSGPLDDFRSQKSKLKLNNNNKEQMKRNPFDGFRNQEDELDNKGKGQMKRNYFDGFRSEDGKLDNKGEGQMKRNYFDGFRIQRRNLTTDDEGQMKRTEEADLRQKGDLNTDGGGQMKRTEEEDLRKKGDLNTDGGGQMKRTEEEDLSKKGDLNTDREGQMKRTHFDSLRRRLRAPDPNGSGQMKRNSFDSIRIQLGRPNRNGSGQMKRNHFDCFRRSQSNLSPTDRGVGQIRRSNNCFKIQRNRQNFGDMETLQTEGSQADRNLPPIRRSNFDYLESEQIQSREMDNEQVESQVNDYNFNEQLKRKKYTDDQEIRQIYGDRLQNLQPELNESPPTLARASNPLSGFDVDYGIPLEKIREVHSNTENDEESSRAEETSPDELLALLVKLVRDKRQKEPQET